MGRRPHLRFGIAGAEAEAAFTELEDLLRTRAAFVHTFLSGQSAVSLTCDCCGLGVSYPRHCEALAGLG